MGVASMGAGNGKEGAWELLMGEGMGGRGYGNC